MATTPALYIDTQSKDPVRARRNAQRMAAVLNKTTTETVVPGSVSGSATFSQTDTSYNYKRVVVYMDALNGTASWTFNVVFRFTPIPVGPYASNVTTLTTAGATITGTTSTGFIIIEGY